MTPPEGLTELVRICDAPSAAAAFRGRTSETCGQDPPTGETMRLRERIKRALPKFMMGPLQVLRNQLAKSPLEEIVLHGYRLAGDTSKAPRLSLIIPSIAP